MATYESLIKITGAVGDLVFYNLNGKNVVRKKSGFNKAAFKKSPTYEKVRQNSSEFGHCSRVGKTIRKCLTPYIQAAGDPLLYQKFAKLMTAIKNRDPLSERGKRTVENGLKTEEGKKLLQEFQFGTIENTKGGIVIDNHSLFAAKDFPAEYVVIVTISMDYENYIAEYEEEVVSLKKKEVLLQKHFSGKEGLLYFAALKNNHDKITHMGFV
ncbi:hypothetical protein [Chryseobacterium pennipullorum]|uniref:Uncharacterized protein n=1 Tax=Chryseobacterium pennipullorum TaxID=2258963 RepID=A0A3D9AMX5_9FLAO|nr:hypothetical protein [Chryseobacterium pennipullorum]REC42688.1 hypothetical protein DRF67_20285 [Chryseobacterium pennipullorum]